MAMPEEFHYRLPGRIGGQRPGSHAGSSIGAGQEFVSHVSLYDRPDPRRLDLRASLRGLNDEWLVRVNRQRSGAAVRALVDVSASMLFGGRRLKLDVVADFVEALGLSAFRVGDAAGMMAFDDTPRPDLFIPARVGRGMGSLMSAALREIYDAGGTNDARSAAASEPRAARRGRDVHGAHGVAGASADDAHGARRVSWRSFPAGGAASTTPTAGPLTDGLEEAASHLAGQQGLVFLVSDFHWPLSRLDVVLDLMAHATVVPVVVWDPAEIEPPTRNGLATLRDAESGAHRTLWLRPKLREEWRRAVAHRRAEIDAFFAAHALRPFYLEGAFDADALSRYFFETDV